MTVPFVQRRLPPTVFSFTSAVLWSTCTDPVTRFPSISPPSPSNNRVKFVSFMKTEPWIVLPLQKNSLGSPMMTWCESTSVTLTLP